MISARSVGKVFRPSGGLGDLFRFRLYGAPVTALDGVSFDVAPGEIVCVMGPNGAGKTTLLRILAGLLLPTSGGAEVARHNVAGDGPTLRRDTSLVIGDERSFHWSISGRQNLHFYAALHGLSATEGYRRTAALIERVGLAEVADRRFSTYSRGMKQRLAIARGLLGRAKVLLLDEPTLGLDPRGARDLRGFLRDEVIKGEGRTALVGSNDPAEVRALGDRVLFLDRGRLTGETVPHEVERFLGLG